MANWSRPSIIEELIIDDEDLGEVDLSGGFVEFSYYESLFSPHITASLAYIDTGNAVRGQNDTQERLGTLYTSTSNFKGKKVRIKMKHESLTTGMEFDTYPLEITNTICISGKDKKKAYAFRLASEYASKNENSSVYEKYYNSISDSVQSILTAKLGVPTNRIIKDATKNSEAFSGLGENPFNLIINLSRMAAPTTGAPGYVFYENINGFNFRSIDGENPFNLIINLSRMAAPTTGAPGYVFYENINGFNFRSIDALFNQATASTGGYIFSDVATWCNASNFRILDYNPPVENDLLTQIRGGVYNINAITFDINTLTFSEQQFKLSEEIESTIGSDEQTDIFQSNNVQEYGRTVFNIIDSGNNEQGISRSVNNNPKDWFASMMRYNSMVANSCDIVVPCNLNLKAGDVIDCSFPKLTSDDSAQGISDEKISGKYLILHLAHHFTSDGQTGSTTHITMVRDTHGLYTSGGEG